MRPPLADVRIIDLTTEADAFCGKLLADLGADVVKLEPPHGELGRRIAPFLRGSSDSTASLLFRHYNTNKRSLALDRKLSDDRVLLERLVAGADALILSGAPRELSERGLDPEDILGRHPRLVVAATSPFGLSGPRRNWKSCDLVAQAMGGMVYVNGRPDEPPLRAWGPQSHHAASLQAAIGILLGLMARDRTGTGQIVDVSLQESVASMLEHVGATFHATREVQERRGTLHWTRTFRTGKCRDGYVLLSILGDWTSLIEWVKADGAGSELADPAWQEVEYRREHCDELFTALDRWAHGYSVRELVEGAQARRLPFAPILSVEDLPRHEQLLARKFFVELGGEVHAGAPYRFSATPWRLRSPAPRCDEHRAEILSELEVAGGQRSGDHPPTPSFVGLSIFSVTALRDAAKIRRLLRASGKNSLKSTTTPFALRRPRFSGAVSKRRSRIYRQSLVRRGRSEISSLEPRGDVSGPPPYEGGGWGVVQSLPQRGNSNAQKQSSPHRPLHNIRVLDFTWVVTGPLATRVLADHGAEVIKIERPDAKGLDRRREALAASLNRGKRSVILNMEEARGIDIARELVRHCDVVIDNFSSRVMTNWGLSYAELRRIKPDIIALGMSGFGRDGPYRDYVSYGPTLQAMAGFTWHMRRPGGEPTGWGFSYSDMVSGYSAAYAILAALWHRWRTGEGQSIDVSQYEALLTFIGPQLLAAAVGTSIPVPSAPHGAPEGIYRCRDLDRDGTIRDRWCALAVFGDEEWERCVGVLASERWAPDPRFKTLAGRIRHREELDARIETWTSQRSAEEVMDGMQAVRIAAGIVADAEDLCVRDAHLAERRYWHSIQTADGRSQTVDAITPRLSHTPGHVTSAAPQPGDDTDQVLRDILHLEQTEIDVLRRERIIA